MKEKLASDLEVSVMQQSEQFDSICHELDILRDQVITQEVIISESKKESELLKCRSEDKFIEVDQLQAEINKVNQTLKIASVALHDVSLQEKTEDLFSLKWELLKEKGTNHLNFKKDKEIELLRKKIAEAVSKLDDIILENENLTASLDDEGLRSFREKIDDIVLENQRLVSLLAAKKKEIVTDFFKISDTSNQLPNVFVGLEDVDQLEKRQWDMEALKIEMCNKDAINKRSLKQLSGELRDRIEDMEMETQADQCIFSSILREVVIDVISSMNIILMKCFEDKKSNSYTLKDGKAANLHSLEPSKSFDGGGSNSDECKFKESICGEEALIISPFEPFCLRRSIRLGHFNVSRDYPFYQVIIDLGVIWEWILVDKLQMLPVDRNLYSAVLVLPEKFGSREIKEMLSIVLRNLRFGSAVVHQEGLAAVFGNGLSTACVINIGAQVAYVICIEDGVVLPSTIITLPYDGEDISRCLLWVQRHHQAWPSINTDPMMKPIDMLMLYKIKESYCQIREGEFGVVLC